MSDLPAGEVYDLIDGFETQQDFAEFVRTQLGIKNREFNDIQADYTGSREQKYQTICLWRRKLGRRATMEILRQREHEFRNKNEDGDNFENCLEGSNNSPLLSQNRASSTTVTQSRGSQSNGLQFEQSGATRTSAGGKSVRTNTGDRTNNRPNGYAQQSFHGTSQPPNLSMNQTFPSDAQARMAPHGATGGESTNQNTSIKAYELGHSLEHSHIGGDADFCNEVKDLSVKMGTPSHFESVLRRKTDIYPIKNNLKGYVLIININFKDRKNERTGARSDVQNMKKLWTDLGCKVRLEEDLSANKIYDVLGKLSKSDKLSKFDFLAIFVMSHGNLLGGDEIVYGDDEKEVYVRDIISKFDNQNCKALCGKPKLFFFQFCRGNLIDSGVSCEQIFDSMHKKYGKCQGDFVQRDSPSPGLPSRSDILLSYATLPGYASYRNAKGSWFINAIANIFSRYAYEDHVADLMTRVRRAVMEKEGYTEIDFENVVVKCKEMSESLDLLTRKLFLLPGYAPNDDPLAD